MRKYVLPVIALLTMAACDKQPTAIEGPSFDWSNNPLDGPKIYRLLMGFNVAWTDPSNMLMAHHRNYPIPGQTTCGLNAVMDPIEHQHLLVKPDEDEWHANDKGYVWVTIRDLNQAGTCIGKKVVAEGEAYYHYIDNDVNGFSPDERNANAWGWVVTGTLTTPEGSTVHYLGKFRMLETNGGFFKVIAQDVKLTY